MISLLRAMFLYCTPSSFTINFDLNTAPGITRYVSNILDVQRLRIPLRLPGIRLHVLPSPRMPWTWSTMNHNRQSQKLNSAATLTTSSQTCSKIITENVSEIPRTYYVSTNSLKSLWTTLNPWCLAFLKPPWAGSVKGPGTKSWNVELSWASWALQYYVD